MTVRLRAPDRRRQLLDATRPRFARSGYRGTTTAELAKAAGITVPILYRHFDGKLDLFLVLIDDAASSLLESWRHAVETVEDPRRRLAALIDVTAASGRSAEARVLLRAMNEQESEPAIAATLRRAVRRLHGLLAAELRRSRVLDAETPAAAVASLLLQLSVGSALLPAGRAATRGLISRVLDLESD